MTVAAQQSPAKARSAWWVIVAYGLLAAATQMLWLTYAPITTATAHRYGVSEGAVGWLSEIFPLLYVVLAIPAGRLLDVRFRPALAIAGALVALGGVMRLGGESFAWAMAGQVMVAVAQPVVMSAISKLAGSYLPSEQRPAGIAAASAASFVGMLVALLLGPALGGAHLMLLLGIEAAIGVLGAVCMAFALLRPELEMGESAAIEGGAAMRLWRRGEFKVICALVFLGFGVFVAISTWLQALLHPAGVSETVSGVLLVGMLIAGVLGCAVLPPVLERRRAERSFMVSVIMVGVLGSIALGVSSSMAPRVVAMVAFGVVLLPALPVMLTLAERLGGPAAGTAGALVWLAGNLGGLVVALIVQALVHHPLGAFLALAAVSALGLPFAMRMSAVLDAVSAAQRQTARAGQPSPQIDAPQPCAAATVAATEQS